MDPIEIPHMSFSHQETDHLSEPPIWDNYSISDIQSEQFKYFYGKFFFFENISSRNLVRIITQCNPTIFELIFRIGPL